MEYIPITNESVVRIDRLDFAYADRLVLKHIDLDVRGGSTFGIVGPNGGGKTTLIRLLVGELQPTRGTIAVGGLSPAKAVRCGDVIGYVPQRSEMNMTVPLSTRQVLDLSCVKPACNRTDYLLQAIGLTDLADEPIGSLSGGQVQRLLIARALVNSPRLLVLDEPTTGIDVASRTQFIKLMQQLRRELALTIILASHDLHTLRILCDDVACLNLTLHIHHRSPGEEIPLDETTCSFRTA